MNHRARVMRRPRRPPPPGAPTAAAVIATAALALLAACGASPSSAGSGGSPNAGGSASSPSAVGYSACVRSHGVPSYPDPGSGGAIPKGSPQQFGVSDSQYQAATQACAHLLPNGGSGRTAAAEVQQEWRGMLNFARCMRAHGVPNWPDPTPYPQYPDEPTFNVPASIQPIPQIISKMDGCLRLVPDNHVVGHIDNNSWQGVQQAMAGL